MTFNQELTDLILKGGQVAFILNHKCTTLLLRMPKGSFIQDDREGNEDNYFEYAWCQNYVDGDDTIYVAGYFNNGLRSAKFRIKEEHSKLQMRMYRAERIEKETKELESK